MFDRRACVQAAASAVALALPGGCATPEAAYLAPHEMAPAAPREFRAAWVASVAHIDWPSRAGLTRSTPHLACGTINAPP